MYEKFTNIRQAFAISGVKGAKVLSFIFPMG